METLAEEQETCQQLRIELDELKQKERLLVERALGQEREIKVIKAEMVDLQQALTDNTCALDARHVGLELAAARRTKKLEKSTSLVGICKWRYPDKRWIGT